MSILFSRPAMFRSFVTKYKLQKKNQDLFNKLLDLCVNFGTEVDEVHDEGELRRLDVVIAHKVQLFLDDPSVVPDLKRIIKLCTVDDGRLIQMGRDICERVLMWSNPNSKLLTTLKYILMLNDKEWKAEDLDLPV